ncbi:Uu.00g026240.m01.CDS01 [Anthostomella pinea]|uniref:Uu.00g026240.m01.CDS01 n=1 Tax=Anthostomella pinea TaxID=933095 RepID=A0AAI8YCH6_9PEZI|nr:Uu.00g026240.m01.CDS01 [Anthostomella pinea]
MESPSSVPARLTFIGGGRLAQAIIDGIYASDVAWSAECPISITGRRPEHVEVLKKKYPKNLVTNNNTDPAIWEQDTITNPSGGHVLFICTLPIDVPHICRELTPVLEKLDENALPTVVTLCPGIFVSQLQGWLPKGTPIVRSMPNLPVTCREGATGLYASSDGASRVDLVVKVFRQVSPASCVLPKEELLDVVAAIAGSAPAHFYYMLESMISAAESFGLPSDTARTLVVQSCLGSGMQARGIDKSIAALREEVCVPGGSTAKAIAHLASKEVPSIVREAIGKSLQANKEMSNVDMN